jgi:hypothetical protein
MSFPKLLWNLIANIRYWEVGLNGWCLGHRIMLLKERAFKSGVLYLTLVSCEDTVRRTTPDGTQIVGFPASITMKG